MKQGPEEFEYALVSSGLSASASGVTYRYSKDLDDKDEGEGKDSWAAWGPLLAGRETGEEWLTVGDRFLPMVVQGVKVFRRCAS